MLSESGTYEIVAGRVGPLGIQEARQSRLDGRRKYF